MASTRRVAVFIGAAFAVVASIGWIVLQRQSYGAPYIDHLVLTISLISGAVLLGVLCGIGAFVGMRLAGFRRVSYRFGIRMVLCYLVVITFINLIPIPAVTLTIGDADWLSPLKGLVLPAIGGLVLPGVIAYALARAATKLLRGET